MIVRCHPIEAFDSEPSRFGFLASEPSRTGRGTGEAEWPYRLGWILRGVRRAVVRAAVRERRRRPLLDDCVTGEGPGRPGRGQRSAYPNALRPLRPACLLYGLVDQLLRGYVLVGLCGGQALAETA